LDADDIWDPDKLADQIAEMQRNDWGFTYTEYNLIDECGRIVGRSGPMRRSVTRRRLLAGCIIQNSTVVYDSFKTGGKVFCPDLRRRQDLGLFLRLLREVDVAYLSGPGRESCSYRQMAGTVSSRKLGNIPFQWRIYRSEEDLGVLRSGFYTVLWIRYAGLKILRRRAALRLHSASLG
jgi:hypothetical protein